ncbi:hypothetical protein CLLI_03520 [Clostridium liquoris]|jgi:transcription elongation factor|uniref:Uncharacterized protein n=1 Tax=Clostridium liquoris TaxID=1289519 RepID=A0A2T0B8V7_9CLOT|nr:DUF3006 domain-containing protein [Clostridium liquoris]PRR80326.1 hypothetical protein CLLI_03520 [Clostridium liquoris]
MRGIIDRIEENYAVVELENRVMINIEKKKIPFSVKEGDVIIINNDNITIDKEETKKLKKEIEELTKDLWED